MREAGRNKKKYHAEKAKDSGREDERERQKD